MKPIDLSGEQVLDYVLAKVRETRRRRRAVKVAAASVSMVLLAWMAIDRPAKRPRHGGIVAERDERQNEPADETLAVVVWRNGVPRLEELGGEQLADLDLDFSLEPVAAYALDDMWSPPGG